MDWFLWSYLFLSVLVLLFDVWLLHFNQVLSHWKGSLSQAVQTDDANDVSSITVCDWKNCSKCRRCSNTTWNWLLLFIVMYIILWSCFLLFTIICGFSVKYLEHQLFFSSRSNLEKVSTNHVNQSCRKTLSRNDISLKLKSFWFFCLISCFSHGDECVKFR